MDHPAKGENLPLTQMSRFGSSSAVPPPTSLEAILSPSPSIASDDSISDPRLQHIRNWTSVTSDTDILVSLMSAWTTFSFLCSQGSREAVLRDFNDDHVL